MVSSSQRYEPIWRTVKLIPEGKVASYALVADLAGLPGRARMVGKAMGFAPTALNVPWYRVVRSNGQIAFPAGSEAAELQTGLLQEEGVAVFNNRVKMKIFEWQPQPAELLFMLDY